MKEVLKPLFEILTGEIAVCDNVLYNYIIMAIVGEIAYRFATTLIGGAYDAHIINGKVIGSICHWGARFVIYVGIAYLICGGIWLYNCIIAVPLWIWWVCVGLVITVVTVVSFVFQAKR